MRTADDIVERVREATNIIDVVSQYVQLRKRGRNFLGLCPFHSEKTPSFNVLEDKGIFKCFGCGAAGDVYSFLMKMEGLTFPEAIEKLASAANIPYEKRSNEHKSDEGQELENLYGACKEFATYCFRSLRSEAGEAAMRYLEERGFDDQILFSYGVGFAPEGGYFLGSLLNKNRKTEFFEKAGIISRNDAGRPYERFRGRIIFPIFSPSGKVIAFGGRILPGTLKETAKYINSPETVIYHKSDVLYGLYQAKDSIRTSDSAILVEGYADVIMLAQAGFRNVIAASGTALTSNQLNLLRRYTKNIILLFDADVAGNNAAHKGIELALSAEFVVNTISLPKGEDPDSFIKKNGATAFKEKLDNPIHFIVAKTQLFEEQGKFNTIDQAATSVRSIIKILLNVSDHIKRALLASQVNKIIINKLQKTYPGKLTEIEKLLNNIAQGEVEQKQQKKIDLSKNDISYAQFHMPNEIEKSLLRAFLEDIQTAYASTVEIDFDFSLIENELVRTIIMHAIRSFEESGQPLSVTEIIDYFRDDMGITKLITEVSLRHHRLSPEWKTPQQDTELTVSITARQAATLIMIEALNSKINQLRSELNGKNEQAQEQILQKLLSYSQEVKILRETVINSP